MKVNSRHPLANLLPCLAAGLILGAAPATTVSAQDGNDETGAPSENPFAEVAQHLDRGGDLYLYLTLDQWLRQLSDTVTEFRPLLRAMTAGDQGNRVQAEQGLQLLTRLIQRSGLEEITAIGLSGKQMRSGLFRTRSVLYHRPGAGQGLLWNAFGREPHPLSLLELAPSSTAMAFGFDLQPAALWSTVVEEMERSDSEAYREWPGMVAGGFESETHIPLKDLLEGFGREHAVLFTLDPEHPVQLPVPEGGITIPRPGLIVLFQVTNSALTDLLTQVAEEADATTVERLGVTLHVIPVPALAPFPIRLTFARDGDLLILGLSDDLVEEVIKLRRGEGRGLTGEPKFRALARNLPLEGNAFSYIGQEFGETLAGIQKQALQAGIRQGEMEAGVQSLLGRLIEWNRAPRAFAVSSMTPIGWTGQSHGDEHPSSVVLKPLLVAPAAIGAGMLLPALAKAKSKAQDINCVNNLKQIGLAARIWAIDHNDKLPGDFKTMRNELGSTRMLVCPADPQRQGTVPDWDTLDNDAVSYEIANPIPEETDVQAVYARCKIHGHFVRVDGSVQQARH
ncbi:MAG: hypothetical protein H7A45_04980 [Verrucomicrobiales bacterium]|nr:hypothetical protein [Verrucomicrobiales bacterium]MCP5527731.1 hypothetical protein [Verrucomicrobiales bacterium]